MPEAIIAGTGAYVPARKLTNEDLAKLNFENSQGEIYTIEPDEIFQKTGIRERHLAAEGQTTSDMAAQAVKSAIGNAGLDPDDVDLLLFATSTPDYKIPKSAPVVALKAGLYGIPSYDFGKDCTGFVEALEAASYYIKAGRYRNIVVAAADHCSSFIDYTNKGTAVIFGDGAGAVVLSATEEPRRGFLRAVAGSQGEGFNKLYIPAGGDAMPFGPFIEQGLDKLQMDGRAVFGYAAQVFAVGVEKVLSEERLVPGDLDLLVPHQSNRRIIEDAIRALDIPLAKVVIDIEKMGNTASATIPIALHHAVQDGRLKNSDLVCLIGYGAGLSWIAALLRW